MTRNDESTRMSANVQHNDLAGTDVVNEISIYLLDRESPVRLVLSKGWTAEHVTRKIAVHHLGVGPVVLEVREGVLLLVWQFILAGLL